MSDSSNLQPIKETLQKANCVYILIAKDPTLDMVSAALGLYQALSESGKSIHVACPTEMTAEFSRLVGIDKVENKIGNRNLIISFPVDDQTHIDKVSYHLDEDGKTFNLVISPKKEAQPLNSDQITYSYSGAQAELVFLVGVNRLEDLNSFYQDEKKLFSDALTVNLTRFPATGTISVNYTDPSTSSLSELAFRLITDLDIKDLNPDSATNLLSGIDSATHQLQHPMLKATTFEVVANLMKAGGIRQIASPSATAFPNRLGANPILPQQLVEMPRPMQKPEPVKVQSDEPDAKPTKIPQDWLTPKIYKANPSTNPNARG